ncbi:Uncharacterised protein [Mycobacteroides abscessus subsp. massiliense]|nr:Uncharacterised protein [Mycobacteroides abscessus subsp. massiliense]
MAQGDCRVLRTPGQQQPEWTPHRDTATDHHDVCPVELHVVATQQIHDPAGRAGKRGLLAEHQPAQVRRVQAVGVLIRVDALQRLVLVKMLGQRQLHDVAGAIRVGVQFVDGGAQCGLIDIGGQITTDRVEAHLGAVCVLAAHIGVRTRVVTHQDGAQPRCLARRLQRRGTSGQLHKDLIAGGLAIKSSRRHTASIPGPTALRASGSSPLTTCPSAGRRRVADAWQAGSRYPRCMRWGTNHLG